MAKNDKKDDGLTILEKVQSICLMAGCPEPDEFLASVMTGVDPRFDASPIYHLISEIVRSNGDAPPNEKEWAQIRTMVLDDPAYRPARVELPVSIKAGERLMDHLYPRLKAVEVTGDAKPREVQPLTESELAKFKKSLDDEY